jgi:hypothetical protein
MLKLLRHMTNNTSSFFYVENTHDISVAKANTFMARTPIELRNYHKL